MPVKFLLHASYSHYSEDVIERLRDHYELTVIFYNPHLYSWGKHVERKKRLIEICEKMQVPFVDLDQEANKWQGLFRAADLNRKNERIKKGKKCPLHVSFRLAKIAEYAAQNHYKYFGTTLASGRSEYADVINSVGKVFARHYKIKFSEVDKKSHSQNKQLNIFQKKYICNTCQFIIERKPLFSSSNCLCCHGSELKNCVL